MSNINHILISGTVSKAATVFNNGSNQSWARGEVTTVRSYTKRDGSTFEKKSRLTFKIFGPSVSSAANQLYEGAHCVLSGRLDEENWQNKETGAWQRDVVIIADNFGSLLTPQPGNYTAYYQQPASAPSAQPPQPQPQAIQPALNPGVVGDSDIPF